MKRRIVIDVERPGDLPPSLQDLEWALERIAVTILPGDVGGEEAHEDGTAYRWRVVIPWAPPGPALTEALKSAGVELKPAEIAAWLGIDLPEMPAEALARHLADEQADFDELERETATHPATADCPIDECAVCSFRDCPSKEDLHYHHDGCPACHDPERIR